MEAKTPATTAGVFPSLHGMAGAIVLEDALALGKEFLPRILHFFFGRQPFARESFSCRALVVIVHNQAVLSVLEVFDFHKNRVAENLQPLRYACSWQKRQNILKVVWKCHVSDPMQVTSQRRLLDLIYGGFPQL